MAVSKGGLPGTVIKANAAGIIVCHRHPSGNRNPSKSDTKITQKIKEDVNLVGQQVAAERLLFDLDEIRLR